MQLHELKSNTAKPQKRVGRGGRRGKTSGRGHKGQKARAGSKLRPAVRDLIKKIPKRRGYGKNRARTVNSGKERSETVNVSDLEKFFEAGDSVTPKELLAKGLVRKQKGRTPKVKILAKGDISKKITVSNCNFSEAAQEKIKKAGGKIN